VLSLLLRPPHGVAFLAAKRFYFGVGGSTIHFLHMVNSDPSGLLMVVFKAFQRKKIIFLQCDVVKVYEDGQSNIREILKVSFRQIPEESVSSVSSANVEDSTMS
jgi:hypothetical protein